MGRTNKWDSKAKQSWTRLYTRYTWPPVHFPLYFHFKSGHLCLVSSSLCVQVTHNYNSEIFPFPVSISHLFFSVFAWTPSHLLKSSLSVQCVHCTNCTSKLVSYLFKVDTHYTSTGCILNILGKVDFYEN